MKKLLLPFVFLLSMGILQGQNLLSNPDFEMGAPGFPADIPGWEFYDGPALTELLPLAAQGAAYGDKGLKMFGNNLTTPGYTQSITLQKIPVSVGDNIEATVEMFSPSDDQISENSQSFMFLSFLDANGNTIPTPTNADLLTAASPTDTWISTSASGIAPMGAVDAKFCMIFQKFSATASGAVFYDNASLRNITEEEAAAAAIPTMGQWSLFILGLIITSLGVVFIGRRSIA